MHHSLRSITSSEAKSNLSPPFAQSVDAGRLVFLALAYSKGLGASSIKSDPVTW